MPAGKAYSSPDALPEEFERYSEEAKLAAMDAYNGAIADGLATGEALAIAHEAASAVDGGQQEGVSDEAMRPKSPPSLSRGAQGPSPMNAGGVTIADQLTV